jgi:hypothetical protein
MRTLRYGGDLLPGDFIAISNGNHINFGWYCGDGRGTLHYYDIYSPGQVYKRFLDWEVAPSDKRSKYDNMKFEKGFTRKSIYKSYVYSVHATRIMKITNIENIFTEQKDREIYEKSREVLVTLNFIKQ